MYAEEQGIRLATLKSPIEPQVGRIDFHGQVGAPSDPRITTWLAASDAERERVAPLLTAQGPIKEHIDVYETYFLDEDGERDELFHDVIDPIYQRLQRGLTEGINAGTELFGRTRHVLVGEVLVAVRGFEWEIELTYGSFDFSINLAEKIARLLLDSLDGRVHARFTAAQLRQWSISPKDRVVQSPGGVLVDARIQRPG